MLVVGVHSFARLIAAGRDVGLQAISMIQHSLWQDDLLVFKTAAVSRIVIWIIGLACVLILRPFDYSIEALTPDPGNNGLWRTFVCFLRWDAVYFLKISEFGYALEKEHAFFPLYPILVRFMSYTGLLKDLQFSGLIDFFSILQFCTPSKRCSDCAVHSFLAPSLLVTFHLLSVLSYFYGKVSIRPHRFNAYSS